jgi:NAD(P)-dependent dehydrogenase (short-subunit alcohol dehydrogenase family)
MKTQFAEKMPIGRTGQSSDIGKTAVFLASEDSSFVLGAEIIVDGGRTLFSHVTAYRLAWDQTRPNR